MAQGCAIFSGPIVAALRILFGGSLKNFNKKRTCIYRVTDYKKKKIIITIIIIIHEVLQLPSTNLQILNCYMIVHYKYLLPMWVTVSL